MVVLISMVEVVVPKRSLFGVLWYVLKKSQNTQGKYYPIFVYVYHKPDCCYVSFGSSCGDGGGSGRDD